MKLSQLNDYVQALFDAGITIALEGPPGIGKTSWSTAYAAWRAKVTGKPFGLVYVLASSMTAPDVMGYLFKKEVVNPDGRMFSMTDPCMPLWYVTEDGKPAWDYEQGLVIVDEFAQAQLDVKAALAPLLLERKIGPWALPAGWNVLTCSNRAKDRSAVTKSLDFVINRVATIQLDHDIKGWMNWAEDANVHWMFRAFAERYPNVVFTEGVPEKQGPWCTPRSFSRAAEFYANVERANPNVLHDDHLPEMLGSLIGDAAATQLVAFSRMQLVVPTPTEVALDPLGCKAPGMDQPDACMVATYMLAEFAEKNNIEPFIKYVKRLPADFAVPFVSRVVKRDRSLMVSPSIRQFASDNSSVMAVVAAA
jgi:hypothetical protein